MNTVEVFQEAGLRVEIAYDDSGCGDPREWDNLAHLYCWHPRYDLGDEQFTQSEFGTIEDVYRHVKRERKATVVLPLFIYDHSGISMSAGARIESLTPRDVSTTNRSPFDSHGWDTSWVGFAYATEERRKLLGVKRSRVEIERQIRNEIEEYDRYLRGEVYGYMVKDSLGHTLDSCWGILGYEWAMTSAKEAAHACVDTL